MEHFRIEPFLAVALTVWIFVKRWYNAIAKIVEPLCTEADLLAQDKVIDLDDRKKLVMKAISLLEAQGSIKLNFLSRLIIGKVVDAVARKLPDIQISLDAEDLLKEARG